MIKEKTKKIALTAAIITLLLFALVFLFFLIKSTNNTKKTEESLEVLSTDLQNEIGGAIETDTYLINYDANTKTVVIKILAEPFKENKKKAIDYLSSKGISLCDTNYTIEAAQGVDNPDWNKENGGNCRP